MKTLWKHQEDAVKLALLQQNFALFHEMGAGKTGTLINILRHRFAVKGKIQRTLIISPLITLQNWRREFGEFSRIPDKDIVVLQGPGKKKVQQFCAAVTDLADRGFTRPKIIILNYEALQNTNLMECILAWRPEILVCDEAHRLRNPQSKRAKAVCKIADYAQNKYILTGSPILNDAQDIFFPYRIMDGGKTFGDNFWAFRNRYFVDVNASWNSKPGYFPDYQPRPEGYKELTQKMYFDANKKSIAHRVLKKDCLDLPPLVKTIHQVELSKDQRRLYQEMKEEYLTYVQSLKNEGTPIAVVANLAITKALRLQQIVTGYVKAEDGKEYVLDENPRLDALTDLLEDACASGKVIVWACFKQNYKQIAAVCDGLKLEYRMLHGEVSPKDKETAMKDFRTDPKVKVMIANQGAGGIGVNLVEAPVCIFFSRNFSLEQDMQAEARNYRGGSNIHEKVTRIDLIATGTIDELVAEALAQKQNIADTILDWKGKI